MIDLVTLQIVRDLVAIFGVIAGLTYYIMNVRNARKARQTQLFMPIYNRMIDQVFLENYFELMTDWKFDSLDEFYEKYGPEINVKDIAKVSSISIFFALIGILLERKEIDLNLVDDTMREFSIRFLEKFNPIFIEQRKRTNNPRLQAGSDYLYNEMKKRQKEST